MNAFNKIIIKNLKLNKKRTIGTIIGIILSVALICAVAGLATSFHETLVQNAINETGYYHIELSEISNQKLEELKLNRNIASIKTKYELGDSYFEHDGDEDQNYIKIMSLNEDDFNGLVYEITEGKFPSNENEIAISKKVLKDSNYKIGDTISLNIGTKTTNDGFELNEDNPILKENGEYLANTKNRTYKIVGVVTKYGTERMYYGITTQEKTDKITAYIALENPTDYKNVFVNILGVDDYEDIEKHNIKNLDYEYEINNELLRWEAFAFSDSTISMLTTVAGVVIIIIILTSVFCIRNSFAISITEKMKMYGMLASIGATKKQIKKSVIYEGMILGLIAVPLGIISGTFAVYVLVQIVNALLGDFLFGGISGMVVKISILPIIISILLGFVTIYLSSITAAKRASKVSPIENLRNTKDIKINSKQLKTPRIISKLFKTGGLLAYKNLKRSKRKYRTTVVSLTVSILVFISMYAFINEGFKQTSLYYTEYDYNFAIRSGLRDMSDKEIEKIRNLDNIEKSYLLYAGKSNIKIRDKSKINFRVESENYNKDDNGEEYIVLQLVALDNQAFKEFAKKIGTNYNEIKDKGILCDGYGFYDKDKKKEIVDRVYKYQKGDIISGQLTDNSKQMNIEVAKVSDIRPFGLETTYYIGGYLVVDRDYYQNIEMQPENLSIVSNNPNILQENIEDTYTDLITFNIEEDTRAQSAVIIVVSIFLYGFITVITLIGVTNIFNTITSNMELRQKEFAMLKSIGMTKKEFNRMINLETIFYSTKSLIYGTILGILGAFAIHQAFGVKTETVFKLPYTAIIISIVFVFVLVYIIMKYSINKINKQNTIETIRKENV